MWQVAHDAQLPKNLKVNVIAGNAIMRAKCALLAVEQIAETVKAQIGTAIH